MEHRIDINEILPAGAFLATRYLDQQRNFITRRVYYENGSVEAFDGNEWWKVCHFDHLQTQQAKKTIIQCGLISGKDLVDTEVFDAAALTFAWRINDKEGVVTNWAYPAVDHPVFEKLETELEVIEKQCAPYQN